MMGYTDTYSLAETTIFRQQCMVSLVQSAISISAEPDTTDNHANRIALAHAVLREPERHTNLMSYAIAYYATDETDTALDTAVGSVWDAYANAYAENTGNVV
jgi:hypothetical protein